VKQRGSKILVPLSQEPPAGWPRGEVGQAAYHPAGYPRRLSAAPGQRRSHFTALAEDAFPQFASRINCFGADWLGNQFATDTGRTADGEPLVLLLEPGTGKAMAIPASFNSFHVHQLVENAEAAVALSFYKRWLAAGGAAPAYDQCVGYRRPLYLGGVDDVENLELSDLDVYWTISAQILAKTRGVSPGTRIGRVSITG